MHGLQTLMPRDQNMWNASGLMPRSSCFDVTGVAIGKPGTRARRLAIQVRDQGTE
jgi:hypothetical protein